MDAAAFSGGKDSTALVLLEAENGGRLRMIFNRTGNELDELNEHIDRISRLAGVPVEEVSAGFTLADLIAHYAALPNNRQRWCTRQLKIQPTIAWLKRNPGTTLLVGLRADEPGREGGLYGEDVPQRFPLRDAGMSEADVWAYLDHRGIKIPRRTDCAWCYDQRLAEWFRLWQEHTDIWMAGEAMEAQTGHTFRSNSRDTWPASMAELRAEFERGRVPLVSIAREEKAGRCRACTI